ncbi:ParB N-terminal domain-containing protein [Actibacterium sp. 188UL27-1]|uniref:ParB/RepB/Spo0J family partition protein n=1 Tax=Actibacterium sp. 188UL27-1 TaxID=2786961 RepID=UPI00195A8CFC|nr:ParB N-terminal domain-containing protein [Actibacterium sp. 188UL27-1]MBM7070404.1 ParB N-terminal domain-containing protein [Actibacterium sp. 188UL27-1]
MTSNNKFGFGPLETKSIPTRAERSVGPMGAAVREAAESLGNATDAKVEQRRRNAEDAKAFRAAQDEGRVLVSLTLGEISVDDLPRDRMELEAVANSDEMEELKSSIRERGQKEPVEVYVGPDGRYQLKKGWRRYTALTQLYAETGEDDFGQITARVETGQGDRMARYIDMVEENVIREDLTFAEMAQVAITAAQDAGIDEIDPATMVGRLYGALHKMKRSYIRSFVFLLSALGDALPWPKEVPRNLGVDVARALKNIEQAEMLKDRLAGCQSADAQNKILAEFLKAEKTEQVGKAVAPKQKFEFFVGATKVTARNGECRIVSESDYATVPKERLEEAVKAFEAALKGRARVRGL